MALVMKPEAWSRLFGLEGPEGLEAASMSPMACSLFMFDLLSHESHVFRRRRRRFVRAHGIRRGCSILDLHDHIDPAMPFVNVPAHHHVEPSRGLINAWNLWLRGCRVNIPKWS